MNTPDSQASPNRTRGAANIAAALRRRILDGEYASGEQLPSERALAGQFEASRGTIRQALQRLEDSKLVSRRMGSGTFVSLPAPLDLGDITERTSPLELIDVRLAIEPHMVRLAVMHASGRDLDTLQRCVDQLEACGHDPDSFSRADESFHMTLAECARNPLISWLYRLINDVRSRAQWSARKDRILSAARIANYNRQHRLLCEAIKGRDMDTAISMITTHLEDARSDLAGSRAA